jgi:hypothetical protein
VSWIKKVFEGGCPDTKIVEVERIVEVEKIVEKEVPVFVDTTEYERAAKEMQDAWKRVIAAEKKCHDLSMSVQYINKTPPTRNDYMYAGIGQYIGRLEQWNIKVAANYMKIFDEKGR